MLMMQEALELALANIACTSFVKAYFKMMLIIMMVMRMDDAYRALALGTFGAQKFHKHISTYDDHDGGDALSTNQTLRRLDCFGGRPESISCKMPTPLKPVHGT